MQKKRDLDTTFNRFWTAIERSQEKHKKAANKHGRLMNLKDGEWVPLKFEKARLQKLKGKEKVYVKLSPWYYGPFTASKVIYEVAFRLELPEHWRIHNAFHISLLKKYQEPKPIEPVLKDPLKLEKFEEIFQPEQIVHHAVPKGPQGKIFFRFLVKFKNYSALNAK